MDDGWNDERVKRLKELWTNGLSAGQIVAEFRSMFTRSAIIGKIHRLGLTARDQNNRPDSAKFVQTMERRKADPNYVKPARSYNTTPVAPSLKAKPTPDRRTQPQRPKTHNITRLPAIENDSDPGLDAALIEPAVGSGIQLNDLTNCTCRWPFGDPLTPNFYFCGTPEAALDEKRPYCRFHARKAAPPARDPKSFHRSALHAAR